MTIKFHYKFEAAHRFLGPSSQKCCTPHGHTWNAHLQLRFTGSELNAQMMGVEFAELKRDWKKIIDEVFDHSYLHNYKDPIVESLLVAHPEARLIPFPGDPTTELIGLLLFSKMDRIIAKSPYSEKVEVDSITIEETKTNQVTCDKDFFSKTIGAFDGFSGWWQKTEVDDRSFSVGK